MVSTEKKPDVILIDLSSVAHPIWHTCQGEPDANACSRLVVERIRKIAGDHLHVAICADSGASFRKELNAAYKANRPEKNAILTDQIKRAIATLQLDGFPVWSVRNAEADDIIATATKKAREADLTVLICTGDKDLAQLVSEHVTLQKVTDGSPLDLDGVKAKFGVTPEQMRDFLTLCGDASDNVQGAKGIGAKIAAELLGKYGSLDALYEQFDKRGGASMGIKPAVAASLKEFKDSGTFPLTRQLITMKDDLDIPFEELSAERQPKQGSPLADTGDAFAGEDEPEETEGAEAEADPGAVAATATPTTPHDSAPPAPKDNVTAFPKAAPPSQPTQQQAEQAALTGTPQGAQPTPTPGALVVRQPNVVEAEIVYERQLDPRGLPQAQHLALDLFRSNLFAGAYGNKEAVLSTIMLGRELGLPAMASLRAVHIIEGRHSLSADAMVALIMKSGLAEYFERLSADDTHAEYETKRIGARNPQKIRYTIEMAKTAGLVKDKSNWAKNPMAMCMARAKAMLARDVYSDLLAGLYTPEELREIAEAS